MKTARNLFITMVLPVSARRQIGLLSSFGAIMCVLAVERYFFQPIYLEVYTFPAFRRFLLPLGERILTFNRSLLKSRFFFPGGTSLTSGCNYSAGCPVRLRSDSFQRLQLCLFSIPLFLWICCWKPATRISFANESDQNIDRYRPDPHC